MDLARDAAWANVFTVSQHEHLAISELFRHDAQRADTFMFTGANLLIDLSRQRLSHDALTVLCELARVCDVEGMREKMFAGEKINTTEQRAVLHTALRAPATAVAIVDGVNVVNEVHAVLNRMAATVGGLRSGKKCGASGKHIRNVVNIGIGGSDLGPAMASHALGEFRDTEITSYFVSNVDPSDLASVLRDLDPFETAFVVASKTFTTQETMANALAARRWLTEAFVELPHGEINARHFFAVTSNVSEAKAFGIADDNIFPMWDWVGGRFSLGSAIGFSVMCSIGEANFRELLAGMRDIDEHFCNAPLESNLPVLLALVGVWNRNALGFGSHAVIPYAQQLLRFPAYLQQLEMESNGKRSARDGSLTTHSTSPVVWGEPGTNGQHAFFQLLHQGTDVVPVDFIGTARSTASGIDESLVQEQHMKLMANMFAQASALAFGSPGATNNEHALGEHRVFPGNRPSTTIVMDSLTPRTLGQLVALYEHKTFVQGCLWGVNSFDQWGVELGKVLAGNVLSLMNNASMNNTSSHDEIDPATAKLIEWFRTRS
jgi:glucose-6-phosphate isomerase